MRPHSAAGSYQAELAGSACSFELHVFTTLRKINPAAESFEAATACCVLFYLYIQYMLPQKLIFEHKVPEFSTNSIAKAIRSTFINSNIRSPQCLYQMPKKMQDRFRIPQTRFSMGLWDIEVVCIM